ncbi:hypothetical protein Cs7R123_05050 [Catellatospora sp. TT07R-123]|uniref:STAS domain-containing protein n=1 Tax=Catellatospora sp. TT07R-123 TaxID=2733863 RepID=UPI001B2D7B88|nr:STAS domain-containing protein [Catellatospora sp. TT07R-123]GHJ43163.1 hypothetical protein Cs7R123_05050 [Catellatospora sp. TT07R-123]
MPEELRIRLRVHAGELRLLVAGEVDLATAYLLGKVTTALLRTRTAASLAMDMSAVTFIDAAGIAAVIGCRRQAARHRLPFSVVNPSRAVAATIGLCGVGHLLAQPVPLGCAAEALASAPTRHRPRRRQPSSARPRPARP